VTDLITTVLETLFTLMSDLATVLLFAVYLLVGSAPSAADDDFETLPDEATTAPPDEEARGEQGGASGATPTRGVRKGPRAKKGAASRAIQAYIRAKVSVSFFVGVVTAVALAAIGLELWLVFAILGAWPRPSSRHRPRGCHPTPRPERHRLLAKLCPRHRDGLRSGPSNARRLARPRLQPRPRLRPSTPLPTNSAEIGRDHARPNPRE